jgi:hypothetical protein
LQCSIVTLPPRLGPVPGEPGFFIAELDNLSCFSSCAQPGPDGGCLATIGWHEWMKAAGAFNGLPRGPRTRNNMLEARTVRSGTHPLADSITAISTRALAKQIHQADCYNGAHDCEKRGIPGA